MSRIKTPEITAAGTVQLFDVTGDEPKQLFGDDLLHQTTRRACRVGSATCGFAEGVLSSDPGVRGSVIVSVECTMGDRCGTTNETLQLALGRMVAPPAPSKTK